MSTATSGIKQTFSVVEDLRRPWDLTGHIATTATLQELTGPRPSKHVKTNMSKQDPGDSAGRAREEHSLQAGPNGDTAHPDTRQAKL